MRHVPPKILLAEIDGQVLEADAAVARNDDTFSVMLIRIRE
jgi:hypothetical protein